MDRSLGTLSDELFYASNVSTTCALGIRDLGENTKPGASLIVMRDIGGAVFTLLIGLMYQSTRSTAAAMIVPLACYLMVGYFALWGCKISPRQRFQR